MIKEVKLPEISENVESGSVASILVSAGDSVSVDQPLLEIETDKASAEIPSPVAGTVKEILVAEGDEVKVGAVITKIDTDDAGDAAVTDADPEELEEGEEPEKSEKPEPKPAAGPEPAPAANGKERDGQHGEGRDERGEKRYDGVPSTAGGSVPASPSTRRLAREIGVDITAVRGSGPGDRVTAEDVKKSACEGATGRRGPTPDAAQGMGSRFALPDFSRWGGTRREKLGSVRRITGENTQAAWQTIPHVTQFDEADVTNLEEFRRRFSGQAEKRGFKLTVTSILIKVVARALQRFPRFNASLDVEAGEIIYKDFISISVAADTDRGLLVPVVREVERKSIMTLSRELGDLAQRARDKKIKPEEMEGGTFTISNLGGIGGTAFTPVVFPPQVAILGVARSQTRPVWNGGEFEPRLILPLSLSYDHRVIDGADGARFVRWICEALEQPLFMELEGGNDE